MFYAFEQDTTPLYTTAKNVFTQEECSKIIEIGKSLNLQNAGLVGNNKGDEKIRKSNVSWIRPEEQYKWIFERVRKFVVYINDNSLTIFVPCAPSNKSKSPPSNSLGSFNIIEKDNLLII